MPYKLAVEILETNFSANLIIRRSEPESKYAVQGGPVTAIDQENQKRGECSHGMCGRGQRRYPREVAHVCARLEKMNIEFITGGKP